MKSYSLRTQRKICRRQRVSKMFTLAASAINARSSTQGKDGFQNRDRIMWPVQSSRTHLVRLSRQYAHWPLQTTMALTGVPCHIALQIHASSIFGPCGGVEYPDPAEPRNKLSNAQTKLSSDSEKWLTGATRLLENPHHIEGHSSWNSTVENSHILVSQFFKAFFSSPATIFAPSGACHLSPICVPLSRSHTRIESSSKPVMMRCLPGMCTTSLHWGDCEELLPGRAILQPPESSAIQRSNAECATQTWKLIRDCSFYS